MTWLFVALIVGSLNVCGCVKLFSVTGDVFLIPSLLCFLLVFKCYLSYSFHLERKMYSTEYVVVMKNGHINYFLKAIT